MARKKLNDGVKNTVRVGDLCVHPLCKEFYAVSAEEDESLRLDIAENGLIDGEIWATTNHEVYVGNRRVRILQATEPDRMIEVNVKDRQGDDLVDFMISSNRYRRKKFLDLYNEIVAIRKKFSPGQGYRSDRKDGKKIDTDKEVEIRMGLSASTCRKIMEIQERNPDLGFVIDRGELSISKARDMAYYEKYQRGDRKSPRTKAAEVSIGCLQETGCDGSNPEVYPVTMADVTDLRHWITLKDGRQIIVQIEFAKEDDDYES